LEEGEGEGVGMGGRIEMGVSEAMGEERGPEVGGGALGAGVWQAERNTSRMSRRREERRRGR
jgi:hypothetical protein